jgi:hypothetical protein
MHLGGGKGVLSSLSKVLTIDEEGRSIIDENYFQGWFVGLWDCYDVNHDGYMDRFEVRDLFKDLFRAA